jgi:hypothetical protein
MRNIEKRNSRVKRSVAIVRRFFATLLFICAVEAVIGIVIYVLHRVAEFDKTLYAYIYLGVTAALFIYLVVRLIRKKLLGGSLLKVTWVLVVLITICGIAAAVLLYGSLFFRFPIAGYISAPFVIFGLIVLLPRMNLLQKLRKLFLAKGY